MEILRTVVAVESKINDWRKEHRLAFVPTMGCLHEGHLSLIHRAKEMASKVVVSIFVNPLQFAPHEDYERYPRTLDEDIDKLNRSKIDLLFLPQKEDIYPESFDTFVRVGKLGRFLCGKSRPHHFDGVATVCLKLFQITRPHMVLMGEKDFQQLRVVQQMVHDFHLGMEVIGCPTVRDSHGLALSSRNRYLNGEEYKRALGIPKALRKAIEDAKLGDKTVGEVLSVVEHELVSHEIKIDYIEIASQNDLVPCKPTIQLASVLLPRLFVAGWVGETRLIDNQALHLEGGYP